MSVAPPPIWQERITCSIQAAQRTGVPASVLLAIAQREAGSPGMWVRNQNGTYDLGSMQLNSSYIASLRQYGVTSASVLAPGCYSYQIAAWRVRNHIHRDSGDYWTRIANYHSRTPRFNAPYRAAIIVAAYRWDHWLRQSVSPRGIELVGGTGSSSVTVTSAFGLRQHPIRGGWREHQGIDIRARAGTPVLASTDGVVSQCGTVGGYGLLVTVDRSDGLQTRYGHLSRVTVARGQVVRRGAVLGLVGATGQATGNHLHYEVRVRGVAVDPLSYMQGQATAAAVNLSPGA